MKNLDKFRSRLKALPAPAKAAARSAMVKHADKVVRMMKAQVPVDTGALRDSIGWTWGAAPGGSLSVGTISAESGMVITIYAGSDRTKRSQSRASGSRARDLKRQGEFMADVARYIEFGVQGKPAQPYFYPILRSTNKDFRGRVNGAAIREMKKVWAR